MRIPQTLQDNTTPASIAKNALLAAVSLFFNGLGLYLTIQANIGAGPWDVLNLGLRHRVHRRVPHHSAD